MKKEIMEDFYPIKINRIEKNRCVLKVGKNFCSFKIEKFETLVGQKRVNIDITVWGKNVESDSYKSLIIPIKPFNKPFII